MTELDNKRQHELFKIIAQSGHLHVGPCDLVDYDFQCLVKKKLIGTYYVSGGRVCHLTDEGTAAAKRLGIT